MMRRERRSGGAPPSTVMRTSTVGIQFKHGNMVLINEKQTCPMMPVGELAGSKMSPVFTPSKKSRANPNRGFWISRPSNPQALGAWTQKKIRVGSACRSAFGLKTVAGRHQKLAFFSTFTTSRIGIYTHEALYYLYTSRLRI